MAFDHMTNMLRIGPTRSLGLLILHFHDPPSSSYVWTLHGLPPASCIACKVRMLKTMAMTTMAGCQLEVQNDGHDIGGPFATAPIPQIVYPFRILIPSLLNYFPQGHPLPLSPVASCNNNGGFNPHRNCMCYNMGCSC